MQLPEQKHSLLQSSSKSNFIIPKKGKSIDKPSLDQWIQAEIGPDRSRTITVGHIECYRKEEKDRIYA